MAMSPIIFILLLCECIKAFKGSTDRVMIKQIKMHLLLPNSFKKKKLKGENKPQTLEKVKG